MSEDAVRDLNTGNAALDSYAAAFVSAASPLLGHLVLYSICESNVTPAELEEWFVELGLDESYAPGALRAVDAYERVTGANGVHRSYPFDDPHRESGAKRSTGVEQGMKVKLMPRHVSRDDNELVRNVVREVRDTGERRLEYEPRLAVCRFTRDNAGEKGAGHLTVEPNELAIAALPPEEQAVVHAMLFDFEEQFRLGCTYLSADKLRAVVRNYVESLNAIRVRQGGGVYFVHRRHAETLAKLRELVSRFAGQSHLTRIPLPDQEEMREMVISSLLTRTKEELDRLALDMAKARRENKGGAVITNLHRRFMELKDAAAEHTELLSTSLGDAQSALDLVNAQFVTLLGAAGGE